jgi:hypothetical protein
MPCQIRILDVKASNLSPLTVSNELVISGTASDCPVVLLSIDCGYGPHIHAANVDLSNCTWQAVLTQGTAWAGCPCGQALEITASCALDSECKDSWRTDALECTSQDEPVCPSIDIQVTELDCDPSTGYRNVEIEVRVRNFTTIPAIVNVVCGTNLIGTLNAIAGQTRTATFPTSLPTGVTHSCVALAPSHPGCDGEEFYIGPLDACPLDCPVIEDIQIINIDGCAMADDVSRNATVTFEAIAPAATNACQYRWNFDDGSAPQTTPGPTVDHTYTSPGTYGVNVTLICGSLCIEPSQSYDVIIPECCSELATDSLIVNLNGCAGNGGTAAVSASVDTASDSAAGTFEWFVDGVSQGTTSDGLSPGIGITTSGSHVIEVEFTPEDPECPSSSLSEEITVDQCPPQRQPRNFICQSLFVLILVFGVVVASISTLLVIINFCIPGVTLPPVVWYILVGLWAAFVILLAIAAVLCRLRICPCLTRCQLLSLLWAMLLTAALTALYIVTCCQPIAGILAASLGALAAAAFALWVRQCEPTLCEIAGLLAIVLASWSVLAFAGVDGIINWITTFFPGNPDVQALLGCQSNIVRNIIGVISAILVPIAITCAGQQAEE